MGFGKGLELGAAPAWISGDPGGSVVPSAHPELPSQIQALGSLWSTEIQQIRIFGKVCCPAESRKFGICQRDP